MDAKKSFVGYCDWLPIFRNLEKEEAGTLIIQILEFVNGLDPEPPDRITKIAFEPIKQQLQRDSIKWFEIVEKRSRAGQASAARRKQDAIKSTSVDTFQQVSTVNENVLVDENVNEINKEKTITHKTTNRFTVSIEDLEVFMLEDEKWVETLSMQNHFTKEETIDWIKKYVSKLKAENEKEKSRKDCFSHCARWINTQKNGKNKQRTNKSGIDPNDTSIFCGES